MLFTRGRGFTSSSKELIQKLTVGIDGLDMVLDSFRLAAFEFVSHLKRRLILLPS